MTELRRHRPRRDQRPRGARLAATAGGSSSRRCTASTTGRCGCPTACAGTSCTCSPRRSTGLRRAGELDGRRRRHLGRRLRAARRRAPRARPPLPLPRRPHRRDGRARVRARAGRAAVRRHRHPDDADQHRLPAARRRGLGGARAPRSGSRSSPTCSRCGCAASSPTSARTPPPPACSTRAAASGRRELIARARAAGAACSAPLVEPGTALGPLLAPPRPRRHARLRGRQPRHRVGVRRRAGRRARGDPLQRHVVAARARAAGAGADRRRARGQPHQRARRSTARRGCSRT